MKLAFEYDDIRTSNVLADSKFDKFFTSHRRIQISGLSAPHVYTDQPLEQVNNKCALPNSLKGPK